MGILTLHMRGEQQVFYYLWILGNSKRIVLWNNQPDREAFGLVRKGVGQSTVLRAVETPYPKVNPIQSNPTVQTSY